jgi:hypothetical protein
MEYPVKARTKAKNDTSTFFCFLLSLSRFYKEGPLLLKTGLTTLFRDGAGLFCVRLSKVSKLACLLILNGCGSCYGFKFELWGTYTSTNSTFDMKAEFFYGIHVLSPAICTRKVSH